jgi:hypothetical protein
VAAPAVMGEGIGEESLRLPCGCIPERELHCPEARKVAQRLRRGKQLAARGNRALFVASLGEAEAHWAMMEEGAA